MRSVLPAVAPAVVAPAETDTTSTLTGLGATLYQHQEEESPQFQIFCATNILEILQTWLAYFILNIDTVLIIN